MLSTIIYLIEWACLVIAFLGFVYAVYLLGKLSGRVEMLSERLTKSVKELKNAHN